MNEQVEAILREFNANPSDFLISPSLSDVWTGPVPGAHALGAWFALRDAFEHTSLWPIIRGEPPKPVIRRRAPRKEGPPVDFAAILAATHYGPVSETLSTRLREQRTFYAERLGLSTPADIDARGLAQVVDASGVLEFTGTPKREREPWPAEPTSTAPIEFLSTRSQRTQTTFPTLELSLVALKNPYETPAYFGFGGGNDCPVPEIQVAVLRDWFERFGAVPAVIAGAVMECVVARPPTNEEESLELAAEQWIFCADIVNQGTMSVRRLAIELWQRPQWFFWWD